MTSRPAPRGAEAGGPPVTGGAHPSSASAQPFAEVAVAPPLRREIPGPVRGVAPHVATFHYEVPEALAATAVAGALVRVPFGRGHRTGVVMRRSSRSPVDAVRALHEVLAQPPLTADLLEVAAWLSAYYIAPLFECVAAMLPPGSVAHELEVYRRTKSPILIADNGPDDLAVLGVLSGGKALTLAEIVRGTGIKRPEPVLIALAERGLIVRGTVKEGRTIGRRRRVYLSLLETSQSAWRAALNHKPGRTGAPAADSRATTTRLKVYGYLATAGEPVVELTLRHDLELAKPVIDGLVELGLVARDDRVVWRDPVAGKSLDRRLPPRLTPEQSAAWQLIREGLEAAWSPGERAPSVAAAVAEAPRPPASGGPDDPPVVLIHGVTGSGKTELYLRAIEATLAAGRSAIVLVPEIALAPQTVQRVAGRFGELVGVWHSHLSDGERRDTWDRAQAGVLRVMVGSRSAVFAPVSRLGLIVLDEEHSDTYKQDATPRYHARDTAIARARAAGAAVLLASATPSVETAWHAQRGRFRHAVLTQRVSPAGRDDLLGPPEAPERTYLPLPEVRIVDMRVELRTGNRSIFSRPLHRALEETLAAGQQAILFLNRRGMSTFVLCRGCGHIVDCPACALPLTFHQGQRLLTCHHCGHAEPPPMMCPMCGSEAIRYFGVGTQRVEAAAQSAFPDARILRWDADTTRKKGAHEALLGAFAAGEADILVGTQMVAKGLDLPEVTLVGVVSADTALGLPDFRSSERTFQLLTQVAGRAGRAASGGRVIVQTYRPDDPSIVAASTHDYATFFERELAFRGEFLYPPYSRLVRLEIQAESEAAARRAAEELAPMLVERVRALGLPDTEIIGPAPAYFRKVRSRYRWQIVVRSTAPHALLGGWVLPVGWRIDVDPTGML